MACGRNVMAERPWVLHRLLSRHIWSSQPLPSPSGADTSLTGKDNSSSYNKGFCLLLPCSHLTPVYFLLWVGFLEAPKRADWLQFKRLYMCLKYTFSRVFCLSQTHLTLMPFSLSSILHKGQKSSLRDFWSPSLVAKNHFCPPWLKSLIP